VAARPKTAPAPKSALPPAPAAPREPRKGGWLLPTAIGLVVAVAGVVALFVYPVSHHAAQNFSIVQPNTGSTTPVSVNVTFAHSGTYSFGWSTADHAMVTFSVWGPGGAASGNRLYSGYNYLAAGQVPITAGDLYTFEFIDTHPETVSVNGFVEWTGPAV
jgi:hypothetical protein